MSQVNGKLSSRVMNMKFMKFSQPNSDIGDGKPVTDETKKSTVPDNSQWDLNSLQSAGKAKKNKRKVIIKKKRVNVRSGVSITDVKRDSDQVVRGRRVIGEPPENLQAKRPREDTEEDDYDLDKLLKQVKNPR